MHQAWRIYYDMICHPSASEKYNYKNGFSDVEFWTRMRDAAVRAQEQARSNSDSEADVGAQL